MTRRSSSPSGYPDSFTMSGCAYGGDWDERSKILQLLWRYSQFAVMLHIVSQVSIG